MNTSRRGVHPFGSDLKMDSYKAVLLVLTCVCSEAVNVDTLTPWLAERLLSPSVYASFPISKDAIVREIERRTAEGNPCDSGKFFCIEVADTSIQ